MDDSLSIGIDLGTTNSCFSYYKNGKVKIMENKEGDRTTPSYLLFSDKNPVIVGKYARSMADMKPEYGVYEIKRLIGREFTDSNIQKNLKYYPFEILNVNNKPVVNVQINDKKYEKTPQELSAYILKKIKNDAEDKLGQTINKAVITVPAYFNVSQREATLEAATKAGFTVLKLLNEPTAAALCYYYKNNCDSESENYSLVYDLGGGTFDVAILKKSKDNIEIVCVDGDSYLGGHDFDNLIIDYVCKILRDVHNCDQNFSRRMARRLRRICEDAKKYLSNIEETDIVLDPKFHKGNEPLEIPITRKQFEEMADPLFKKTIDIVDCCLKNAKLEKSDIKEVILSGGSTRIPKIQELLTEYFNGKKLNKFNNPDECVAKGAALQAALLSTHPEQVIDKIKITDVIPLSLGIRVLGGFMSFLVRKNTPIPIAQNHSFYNSSHNETSLTFKLYEGERTDVRKNYFLGDLVIDGLTKAPPGQCEVVVTLTVDQNGILTIKAKEVLKNNTKDLKIAYTRGHRSENEIKSAIATARENEIEDQEFLYFATNKQYLLKYLKRAIYNFETKKIAKEYKNIYDRCIELINLVDDLNIEDSEFMEMLKKEIQGKCVPLEKKYKFEHMPTE